MRRPRRRRVLPVHPHGVQRPLRRMARVAGLRPRSGRRPACKVIPPPGSLMPAFTAPTPGKPGSSAPGCPALRGWAVDGPAYHGRSWLLTRRGEWFHSSARGDGFRWRGVFRRRREARGHRRDDPAAVDRQRLHAPRTGTTTHLGLLVPAMPASRSGRAAGARPAVCLTRRPGTGAPAIEVQPGAWRRRAEPRPRPGCRHGDADTLRRRRPRPGPHPAARAAPGRPGPGGCQRRAPWRAATPPTNSRAHLRAVLRTAASVASPWR